MTDSTTDTNGKSAKNGTFVGRIRMKAIGDRTTLEAADGTEAYLRGALFIGWLARHPKLAFPMLLGGATGIIGLMATFIAITHVLFAPPGSRPFVMTDVTTWIPSAADRWVREPVGRGINAVRDAWNSSSNNSGSEVQDGAGDYDAEDF